MNLFTVQIPIITAAFDIGRKCGVALYDVNRSDWIDLKTLDFWPAVGVLNELAEGRDRNTTGTVKGVTVIVEQPGKNKPVFEIDSEKDMFTKALSTRNQELLNQAIRTFAKRAQNIGMNKERTTVFVEIARMKGFRVIEQAPNRKKMNAEDFNRRYKYNGSTSQHARDAARLVLPY